MVKAGLIRAGPVEGFLATTWVINGQEGIVLSDKYPAFNNIEENLCSLVHEMGPPRSLTLAMNKIRAEEELARKWLQANEALIGLEVVKRIHSRECNEARAIKTPK